MDYDGQKDCSLLENCMKETLRLRPPIMTMMRMAMEEVVRTYVYNIFNWIHLHVYLTPRVEIKCNLNLFYVTDYIYIIFHPQSVNGYTIPAGHQVCVSPTTNQRLPDTWENPADFDPDR